MTSNSLPDKTENGGVAELKYFSMFSGIGGFELGIGERGECIGYSEIDKYAIKVYERHFKHENKGNATTINERELPDFDLLVGGFPCQAFSIAGKRQGFNETRGTLFFDIARILKYKRPRHFVLENVKGLLSHDGGKTFQTILKVLTDLGYSVEWQVLNAKDFGVPQNRERIFIVGHLGGFGGRKVFPITGNDRQVRLPDDAIAWSKSHRTGKSSADYKRKNYGKTELRIVRGLANTVNTGDGGSNQSTATFVYDDYNSKFRTDGNIGSLTTNIGSKALRNGTKLFEGARIRRLTPLECERLMAYPDNWTKYGVGDEPISDTQRYKMCGNGIVSNVVEAVMEKLYEQTYDR